jgi:hypothetical protein
VNDGPYRVPAPEPPDPYLAAWASLRRRRFTMGTVAVGLVWIVFPVCLGALVRHTAATMLVAIAVVLAAAVVARLAFSWPAFRCPRCLRPFFRAPALQFGLLVEPCPHCGLEIGTPMNPR